MRLLAFCGSLRQQSTNLRVLQICQELLSPPHSFDLYSVAAQLPYYNPDQESSLPDAIKELRLAVRKADALLIATPEYAHGMPGVLKSILDCLVSDSGIVHKPVGLIFGAAGDAKHTDASLCEVLKTMSAKLSPHTQLNLFGLPSRLKQHGHGLSSEDRRAVANLLDALVVETKTATEYDRNVLWK